jgi:hypothetical protein
MTSRSILGFAAGTLVGGAPFWLLGFAPNDFRPGLVAIAVAAALSATAYRAPGAWGLGVFAGVPASWAAVALIIGGDWRSIGSDWRLLPYVVILSGVYYAAAAAALAGAWAVTRTRPRAENV